MSCELLFVFKQKTAYEMRISDWSSDVCSSDLSLPRPPPPIPLPLSSPRVAKAAGWSFARSAKDTPPMEVAGLYVESRGFRPRHEIGRAHVCTPVTNAQLVCRLLLDKTNLNTTHLVCYTSLKNTKTSIKKR